MRYTDELPYGPTNIGNRQVPLKSKAQTENAKRSAAEGRRRAVKPIVFDADRAVAGALRMLAEYEES